MSTHRILILGGTTEARRLAERLRLRSDCEVTLSLAGRTANPVEQPVPVRIGGFGGARGLASYLHDRQVDLLIDATHPYAARISANAAEGSRMAGVPLVAFGRPAWTAQAGDRWTEVEDGMAAVRALGEAPRRVFLALGRQDLAPFEAAPQHSYLIRSVDPIEPPLSIPDATYILARGPFAEEDEHALLIEQRVEAIVAKNSGGSATYGKIAAARALEIPVILLRRPAGSGVPSVATLEDAIAAVDHRLASRSVRGE